MFWRKIEFVNSGVYLRDADFDFLKIDNDNLTFFRGLLFIMNILLLHFTQHQSLDKKIVLKAVRFSDIFSLKQTLISFL